MKHFNYIGAVPYCYSNSFSMMFGRDAPDTAVIEFATGSPFGMQLVGGTLPFFDPYGWTPEAGFDGALEAMGWISASENGGTPQEALDRLKAALAEGPVWVGPVEMGWLRHQPGKDGPMAADHYIVVLAVENGRVKMHDPEGTPLRVLATRRFHGRLAGGNPGPRPALYDADWFPARAGGRRRRHHQGLIARCGPVVVHAVLATPARRHARQCRGDRGSCSHD